jgi:hypothetical protein
VRRAWADGLTRDQVAAAAGITIHVLEARRQDQLADLPDRNRRVNSGRRGGDPTPEEIWGQITAGIQAKWTDDEREEAWKGSRFRR